MVSTQEKILAEDFVKFLLPTSPALSPNGKKLIFSIKSVNDAKNTYKAPLYIKQQDQAGYQQFTAGTHVDTGAKFSPCGKYLAFLSSRSEKGMQVYVMHISGGEAFQITTFPAGVLNFTWSHNSKFIHVLAPVTQEELQQILEPEKEKLPSFVLKPIEFDVYNTKKKRKLNLLTDPRSITEAFCRAGASYLDGRFNHPFVIPVSLPDNTSIETSEKPKLPISVGEFGYHYILGIFSLDDQFLYYSRIKDPAISLEREIFRVEISNFKNIVSLGSFFGFVDNFQLSPDGKFLSFEGLRKKAGIFDDVQIFLYDLDKDEKNQFIPITEDYERSAYLSRWVSNDSLLFLTTKDGRISIFKINFNTRKVEEIVGGDRNINSFTVSKNGTKISYEISHASFPADIFWCEGDGQNEERVTDANKTYLETHKPAKVEAFTYERDGVEFQGWLLLPSDYEKKDKIPIILEIHGGPAVMWTPHENTMWHEWNTLVSKGYAIVFCNPRGSDGYGSDFRGAVFQNWGDLPANDILKALDTALERYPFLDSNRLAITGGSYGGYMTAWLVTHIDRFKAAVSQRGVYEFAAFSMTTDIPIWFEKEYDIDLIDDFTDYWRDSPLKYIKNLKTPLLIIHSDNDFRAPIINAEQLFWASKRYGKTVELVRYPREGHELSRSGEPRHRIDRINKIEQWITKYMT
ncbi:MAG: S9 family peptidase [Candidatus Hodarchaeota archaeon]